MQYTNKYGLPKPIVDAIVRSDYDNPDGYSISRLISPAYQTRLIKEFNAEVTMDVADSLWALLGTSVHAIIEKAGTDIVKELRVYKQFDDTLVSGKADYYAPVDKEIIDFKVTSKYAVQYGKVKPEWEQQLNILAYLFNELGLKVEKIAILAILRDWTSKDRLKHEFTDVPFMRLTVPLWNKEKTELFIKERLNAHQYAQLMPIAMLSPCSAEERWQSDEVYAVKKNNLTKATKLCETEAEAIAYCREKGFTIGTTGSQYSIERRPGLGRRCIDYCSVKRFCSHALEQGY